jgi:hypothetical protein
LIPLSFLRWPIGWNAEQENCPFGELFALNVEYFPQNGKNSIFWINSRFGPNSRSEFTLFVLQWFLHEKTRCESGFCRFLIGWYLSNPLQLTSASSLKANHSLLVAAKLFVGLRYPSPVASQQSRLCFAQLKLI